MTEEKIFTIPLRKEILKVPSYMRASKAVKATRSFLIKNLKSEVKIGKYLNETLNMYGRKHTVNRVQVKVWKEGDLFKADLVNATTEIKEEVKKETEKIKEGKAEIKEIKKEQIKEEEKEKKFDKEKEDVLEHKTVIHKTKGTKGELKELGERKKKVPAMERLERTKKIFSKNQKPKHEKKK